MTVAVAVKLSTAIGASMNGATAIRYFPGFCEAVRRTLAVWPGEMTTVSVLNGFV